MLSSLIRISTDHRIFAPPRSFSQLVTSFFGATYQGILRKPFVAWSFFFFVYLSSLQKNSTLFTRLISLLQSWALKLLLTSFTCINQISFIFTNMNFLLPFRTRLYISYINLFILSCYAVVNLLFHLSTDKPPSKNTLADWQLIYITINER